MGLDSAYEERIADASAECRQESRLDGSARTNSVGDRQPRVAQLVGRLGRRPRVRAVCALGAQRAPAETEQSGRHVSRLLCYTTQRAQPQRLQTNQSSVINHHSSEITSLLLLLAGAPASERTPAAEHVARVHALRARRVLPAGARVYPIHLNAIDTVQRILFST